MPLIWTRQRLILDIQNKMTDLNVLNNTEQPVVDKPKEQERINVSNIPPKSIGERELQDTVIIKKMTTTERDAIASPVDGTVIYNLTTLKLNFYNGSAWAVVTSV